MTPRGIFVPQALGMSIPGDALPPGEYANAVLPGLPYRTHTGPALPEEFYVRQPHSSGARTVRG